MTSSGQAQTDIRRAAPDRAPPRGTAAPVNAMTVDVEDYFQVQAFAGHIARDDWDSLECRVEANTERVLALFEAAGVTATFFTLGWVAQRYPALVRRIAAGGHELASHGMQHARVDSQTPAQFRADIRAAKRLLEDVGGTEVRGYRAATFSIGEQQDWAFPILAEEGHAYSSSVYPVQTDFYGIPNASRFPFRPEGSGIVEIPMTTARLLGRNRQCAGGGYFRLYPYALSRWLMRQVNEVDGQPCIFYFHPWEVDPDQPRQHQAPLKSRLRHYLNLQRMQPRLTRLLRDFTWGRMDRAFADAIAGA